MVRLSIVMEALRTLSLRDELSPAGRAAARHRRGALTVASSMIARVVSLTAGLLSVPLTLSYLGTERYGVWLTLASAITVLNFVDLGLGCGLLTATAQTSADPDTRRLRAYISSAHVALLAIALVLAGMVLLVAQVVPPPYEWFKVTSATARQEVGPAVLAFAAMFILNLPFGAVMRVQTGLQQGYVASIWQTITSLFGLAALLFAIHLEADLPTLVLVLMAAPLVANVLNTVHYFTRVRPDLSPRFSAVTRDSLKSVLSTGVLFLILQIAGAISFSADNLIIARTLGVSSVPEYAVTERLFGLIPALWTILLTPLWPAYGEAIARGDRDWVRATFRRSLIVAVGGSALIACALYLFAVPLMDLWVGSAIQPSAVLLLGLGIWKVMEAGGASMAMFMNGANLLRMQATMGCLVAASALALKMLWVEEVGTAGLPLATIVSYATFVILPSIFLIPRALRRL